ncbi:MAG: ImmA/IrrE family metallo-endopeptidase [Acidobacteria bacterium]|nr:ImmA/IrrE family metallo-endopeptidase [Acidobacteriota bacterium]
MSARLARLKADELYERMGNKSLPVDVYNIAKRLGLKITETKLGGEISGMLISRAGSNYIFVEVDDHPHRKRFSVGHEIAHFYLGHQSQHGEHVIIDRGYSISKRDGKASTGQNQKEIEANQFAATLLMPSKLLREKVKEVRGLPLHDYQVEKLAKIFYVSEQAMMHRLSNLGLL